jgi:predicted ATPase
LIDRIVAQSEGVPLFIEELTAAVQEGSMTATPEATAISVPATLRASLLARLDRLGPSKEVAQLGSVLGREFPFPLLAAVAGLAAEPLSVHLDRLVQAQLLFRHGDAQETYVFKHVLIQDAAYESLLLSRRRNLHVRVAAALTTLYPEIAETQPALLAWHYGEAGQHDSAAAWWHRAGTQNIHRSANSEAARQFGRGLEMLALLPDQPERDEREMEMRTALGVALAGTSGYTAPEWEANMSRMLALAERIGETGKLLPVLWQQWVFVFSGCHDMDRALRLARRLFELAERLADPGAIMVAHRILGMSLVGLGQVVPARRHLEQTVTQYIAEQHAQLAYVFALDQRLVAMAYLALALVQGGFIEQGQRISDAACAEAFAADHATTIGLVLGMRLGVGMLLRESEAIRATADDLLRLLSHHPHRGREVVATAMLALLDTYETGSAETLAAAQAGLDELHRMNWPFWVPWLQMLLVEAHLRYRRHDAARRLLDRLESFINATAYTLLEAELHRLRAELLRATGGDTIAVERRFISAIGVAHRQGAMLAQLRAATGLARHLHDLGRSEAGAVLEPVLGWFTEGLDSTDVLLAKSILASIGRHGA